VTAQQHAGDLTVGDVARLAGVSVRTLHHYDEIGLLRPSGRTAAGYRLYGTEDLARLRRILVYRELDFGLVAIAAMLAEDASETDAQLRRQHRMVRDRIARSTQLLAALEKEMEARDMGIGLSREEQFEVFGTDQVSGEWADEARERWGDTDAHHQSQRRTAGYTKQDWVMLKEVSDENVRAFATAMRDGAPAEGDRATELAEEHRQYLGRWFYDCSYEMHRGLAELYIADDRFAATYEAIEPGLARYVRDAIVANADRAAG
jgi:DNA-binding transcriptional MerR regulator